MQLFIAGENEAQLWPHEWEQVIAMLPRVPNGIRMVPRLHEELGRDRQTRTVRISLEAHELEAVRTAITLLEGK